MRETDSDPSDENPESLHGSWLLLHKTISKASERIWGITQQKLWDRFVEQLEKSEAYELQRQGFKGKQIARLLTKKWAIIGPENEGLRFVEAPESNGVPVLFVLEDEEMVVHPLVAKYLPLHPWLRHPDSSDSSGSPKQQFDQWMSSLAELGVMNLPKTAPETDGILPASDPAEENNLKHAYDYDVAFCRLLDALNPRGSSSENADSDPVWLSSAKTEDAFWELLNAVVEAGAAMERHMIFKDPRVQESIQIDLAGHLGKQASAQGQAIEEILRQYEEETSKSPTTKRVVQWLRAEKIVSNERPLEHFRFKLSRIGQA